MVPVALQLFLSGSRGAIAFHIRAGAAVHWVTTRFSFSSFCQWLDPAARRLIERSLSWSVLSCVYSRRTIAAEILVWATVHSLWPSGPKQGHYCIRRSPPPALRRRPANLASPGAASPWQRAHRRRPPRSLPPTPTVRKSLLPAAPRHQV